MRPGLREYNILNNRQISPGDIHKKMNKLIKLQNARIPVPLLETDCTSLKINDENLALVDLYIANGKLDMIHPAGNDTHASHADDKYELIDLDQGQVWPCYVDIHTHLDKSHISSRTRNPDGSLLGAIQAEKADQENYWSEDDLRKRMGFALQCAYAHGTRAIRSHLCSEKATRDKTWKIFQELKTDWSDRLSLQAVSILNIDLCAGKQGEQLADFVARQNGVLGCAMLDSNTHKNPAILDHLMQLAMERNLDLDFHADENANPDSNGLRQIAEAVIRNNFERIVLVGHCCSLSLQDEATVNNTLDLVAEANISIVSLPSTNMYLQDRKPGTTPKWRGITRLQEIAAQRIPIALASDNCRDLFNFFGDYDLHRIFADAVLGGHLDSNIAQWTTAVTTTPSKIMHLPEQALIKEGCSADLVLFSARSYGELLSRPQPDRRVLRKGQIITALAPDYRLLDPS